MAEQGRTSRPNTLDEKRRMKNDRKRRRRSRTKALEAQLQHERALRSDSDKKVTLYRNMSRSYWERWQWELQRRKDILARERAISRGFQGRDAHRAPIIHEIDPELLRNPTDCDENQTYIGRGSFGVVRVQIYRGIKVAVKELLPRSLASDVRHEAGILAMFCHPYLPLLFGIHTATQPYKIVMQYHSLHQEGKSTTLYDVLSTSEICGEYTIVMLCIQLMEAVRYMHDDVKVLHNDLKCNNLLVCDSVAEPPAPSSSERCVQILIIDFGKATAVDSGKHYHLNDLEKTEYTRRYTHILPEVTEGLPRQTKMNDIYAVGGILQHVVGSRKLTTYEIKKAVDDLATKCRSPKYFTRPSAAKALNYLQLIL